MIGTVDVEVQAANPNMPLHPWRAFVSSPSSLRLRNVPKRIGDWHITSVSIVAVYPDGSIVSAECVLTGGVWVGTVAGTATSGTSENGYTVMAAGVDENGRPVTGYVLGKGNVEILKADGTLAPDAPAYYVKLFDEAPEAPNEGDMWPTADGFVIWQDGEAHALGGSSITVDPSLSPTSENPVQNKVVTKALYTGFTEWVCDSIEPGYAFTSCIWADYMDSTGWVCTMSDDGGELTFYLGSNQEATSLSHTSPFIVITRHLITPTKTSQLTNDGPSSGPNVGHPFATTNQIPDPVDISGKLDGAAAYPAWDATQAYYEQIVSYGGRLWYANGTASIGVAPPEYPWVERIVSELLGTKQDALSSAQLAAVNSGATAAKVATWDGYAAQIAQKANASDLPYAMVTLTVGSGAWTFSGSTQSGAVYSVSVESDGGTGYNYTLLADGSYIEQTNRSTDAELEVEFTGVGITATRPYANGADLLDRAGNLVVVTGDTTLTLPELVNAGKLRDFLVRLEISGSTAPTITFAAPTGETVTYETDGDEFPVPDEAGDWLYSFTESCVAHKFAVSLKKVNEVAAPQAQGGS